MFLGLNSLFRKCVVNYLKLLRVKMPSVSKVVISTGNVLNLIEIKQKAGQNVTEELVESLQITVSEWQKAIKSADSCHMSNGTDSDGDSTVFISRLNEDLHAKMIEEERKNLKIGIKIFIQDDGVQSLKECLDNVYKVLSIDLIDNVILAYNPPSKNEVISNSLSNGDGPTDSADDNSVQTEGLKCEKVLPGLKVVWSALEKYVEEGKITQLGVADLDESCFRQLHRWGGVKPTIVQINLASCCVVPPGLQTFCKDNDVQLLTHSDPPEIVTSKCLGGILDGSVTKIDWCVRYQVHIRCRGVLTLKGYITCALVDKAK